jgi:DNA gyrase subunit A
VRIIGRNTQGVRLINLEEGDTLVSVSVIEAVEETADAAEPETEAIAAPPAKTDTTPPPTI